MKIFTTPTLVLLLCILCNSFTANAQPSITSFSPRSGPVGTVVAIKGKNFASTSSGNVIYFGSVKATIVSASDSVIYTIAPPGSTFQPISVTTNALTCHTNTGFIVTFPGSDEITPASFTKIIDLSVGITPQYISIGDIDGDAKPDVIVVNANSDAISIFRNISVPGTISFAPQVNFFVGTKPVNSTVADIDGDGKLDLAVVNTSSHNISILKNLSQPGTISLAPQFLVATTYNPTSVAVADFNEDGLQDLAVSSSNMAVASVHRNMGSTSGFQFAPKLDFLTYGPGYFLTVSDVDQNKKPDIIFANFYKDSVTVLKNESVNNSIAFSSAVHFSCGSQPMGVAIGDIDGNTVTDIITANSYNVNLSVLRNTGLPGSINFDTKKLYVTAGVGNGVAISDFNGDGLIDVLTSNGSANSFSIMRNTSIQGTISFATKTDYQLTTDVNFPAVADLDGDNKPDLVIANSTSNRVAIYRNTILAPFISNVSPNVGGNGLTVTINGNNFSNVSAVTFGGMPATSFSVVTPKQIRAVVGSGNAGIVSVTTSEGVANLPGFSYTNLPVIASLTPDNGDSGTMVVIKGANFNGASEVKFGGIPVLNFTVDSVNQITAIVGQLPIGTINVSVSTSYGTGSLIGFYSGPIIKSLTPTSGPVGSTVTINGLNFSTDTANITVYFGATKAKILSASLKKVTVVVPSGATYDFVTIISNGLISYSSTKFHVTFSADAILNINSFTRTDLAVSTKPISIASGDIDQDGLPDIVVLHNSPGSLMILRSTGSTGMVSFAPPVNIAITGSPQSVTTGDVDGDGKIDVVVTSTSPNSVYVFRNISTAGNINFATKVAYSTGTQPALDVAIGDLNGDGKSDIVTANTNASTVTVFKNTGIPGSISFTNKIDLSTGSLLPNSIGIGDFNLDGKPDLAISDYTSIYDSLSIFINKSSPDTLSFLSKKDFSKARGSLGIAIGDVNNDGKLDIATTCWVSSQISFFGNLSTPGTLMLDTRKDFGTGSSPQGISISDLNGDGKADFVVANYNASSISIHQNGYTGGLSTFGSKIDFQAGTNPKDIIVVDLNRDNKPDIVSSNINANTITVLRNTITTATEFCPGSSITLQSDITGSTYQWQVGYDSTFVFSDIQNDSSYSGTNSQTLSITNFSTIAGIKYRCNVNGVYTAPVRTVVVNRWVSVSDISWNNPSNWSCGTVPDSNTDVIINSGNIIINSDVVIRSLTLNPSVTITVTPGFTLTILH